MHVRVHYILPFCLLFACNNVERDWSKCSTVNRCKDGYVCTEDWRCVPKDGGVGDGPVADVALAPGDVGSPEAPGADGPLNVDAAADVRVDARADTTAEVSADAVAEAPVDAPADTAVDAPADRPLADAAADLALDTRPPDSEGSCSTDIDCDASAPLCLAFRCAKCTSNNECASRAGGGTGGGVCDTTSGKCVACVQSSECTADPTKPVCMANKCVACTANGQCSSRGDGSVTTGVCDTTTGRCVACVKSSECTADPAKPVCAANQCAACKSAESECRIKNSGAPVCDQSSGKCVGCLNNNHCSGSTDGGVDGGDDGEDAGADGGVVAGFCYLATNQCVECLAHGDCKDPSRPICSSLHTCVGCGAQNLPASVCAAKNPALPACKTDTGTCVECTGDGNCAGDAGLRVCNTGTNKCVECTSNAHCPANTSTSFCVNNSCKGCQTAGTGACTSSAKPLCATYGSYVGQCVECIGNTDCKVGTNPVCDTNQCRACARDSDCTNISPAGVCGLDGSCPGDNAVIYLQNSTLASPYCSSDDATRALSMSKSVIVVKGPLAVGNLTLDFALKPVLIAGQSSANLTKPTTGTPPLVSITAGDVTLRDLTISGGNDVGVSVSGGATLRMDRCYVSGNRGIGIQASASAFDIINTVIASNGTATGGYGVSLGSYSGSPTRFAFNTVVNNTGRLDQLHLDNTIPRRQLPPNLLIALPRPRRRNLPDRRHRWRHAAQRHGLRLWRRRVLIP